MGEGVIPVIGEPLPSRGRLERVTVPPPLRRVHPRRPLRKCRVVTGKEHVRNVFETKEIRGPKGGSVDENSGGTLTTLRTPTSNPGTGPPSLGVGVRQCHEA